MRQHVLLIEPAVLLFSIVEVEGALANRLLHDNATDPAEIRGLLVRHGQ